MTVNENKVICGSDVVQSGGTGFRFKLISESQSTLAFLIRFNGIIYAYLNRCAHLMLELDWDDAEYFNASGEYILCSNHGAMFEPATGLCIDGPCYGASLTPVSVVEVDSKIVLNDERFSLDREEN